MESRRVGPPRAAKASTPLGDETDASTSSSDIGPLRPRSRISDSETDTGPRASSPDQARSSSAMARGRGNRGGNIHSPLRLSFDSFLFRRVLFS